MKEILVSYRVPENTNESDLLRMICEGMSNYRETKGKEQLLNHQEFSNEIAQMGNKTRVFMRLMQDKLEARLQLIDFLQRTGNVKVFTREP